VKNSMHRIATLAVEQTKQTAQYLMFVACLMLAGSLSAFAASSSQVGRVLTQQSLTDGCVPTDCEGIQPDGFSNRTRYGYPRDCDLDRGLQHDWQFRRLSELKWRTLHGLWISARAEPLLLKKIKLNENIASYVKPCGGI
jgi:hypothetical protein